MASSHGHRHLDTDDYFWLPTNPPFRETRPHGARLELLRRSMGESNSWVLSGSLCGWGDPLVPEFELIVFLTVPTPIRLARLGIREHERYGPHAITPGGAYHGAHVEFLQWAARYDTAGLEMRSRALHEAWLATVSCRVIRLDGDLSLREQLTRIEQFGAAP